MGITLTHSKISKIFLITFIISNLSVIFYSQETFAQKTESINLFDLQYKEVKVINREAVYVDTADKKYLSLSRDKEVGLIWLPVEEFQNGSIEIVMRGKNEFQRSFIGIAFHGSNDSTYDAVYCRPFNFFAEGSIRRIRSIQYISHPTYTWEKLRTEQNGVFEKEIINPPDPDDWFKMTLVIDDKLIKAFINSNETPSLIVEKLDDRTSGKLGIFVADNSGGDFERIEIKYK